MPRRSRSLSLSTPKYLPYEAQHVLLNTIQRLLEESCFEFAKTWFENDHRVRAWTTPAQVEISKWRDLLGTARIPSEALDGNVQTPLRVLLQEATHLRNNAVHRSQVHVEDILKLLTSAIQLTRMLRDQTRRTKIEDIRGRLIYELNIRDDNRARATFEYRKVRDDIDRRKEPVFKKLDKLYDEEDNAVRVFEKGSVLNDNELERAVVKFINQVIHTGEEIARIAPAAPAIDSTQKPQLIVKSSNMVTDGKQSEGSRGRDDDDVQFISKTDFEVATSESRNPRKKLVQTVGPGSKDQEIFFKQDHTEGVLLSIRPAPSGTNLVEVQSTPGSRNRENSSCGGAKGTETPGIRKRGDSSYGGGECSTRSSSKGATPRALSVVKGHFGTEPEIDSPSRQLELEANMANSIRELSIGEYDILENLDAELDNQLMRTVNEARASVDSVLDQINSDVRPSVEEPLPNSTACGNSNVQNDTNSCHSWTEPCVLARRVPSSELKMTDRSFAPSPDVEMSGVHVDAANDATENSTTTADAAAENGPTNLRKEESPQTAVGLQVVEFGKPWKPRTNASVSITRIEKTQEKILQTVAGLPSKPSVSITGTKKPKEVNLSNIHLWRKRKAVSPLSERTPASYYSMISNRPHALPISRKFCFSTGMALNVTGNQPTTSSAGPPMMISFGDVAMFAKTMGPNPTASAELTSVGYMGVSQINKPQETMGPNPTTFSLFATAPNTNAWQINNPQETPAMDVITSRQAATWERRRILVGALSFTPSKAEVEKLFVGYDITRVDFPEMWIMGIQNKPAGGVFVDFATAAQAKLVIQKMNGEEPKIRNCRVSIILASDPWKVPRKGPIKPKKKKKTGGPSGLAQTVRKSEPIGKRTRSYYAAMRAKNLPDDQSSKRQKLMAEAPKDTGTLAGNQFPSDALF